jgi:hypothetical protein
MSHPVRQIAAFQMCDQVIDGHQSHVLPYLERGSAEMGQQGDMLHRHQCGGNFRFKLIDIKARTGDLTGLQRRDQSTTSPREMLMKMPEGFIAAKVVVFRR